jgi:hypothetical protein
MSRKRNAWTLVRVCVRVAPTLLSGNGGDYFPLRRESSLDTHRAQTGVSAMRSCSPFGDLWCLKIRARNRSQCCRSRCVSNRPAKLSAQREASAARSDRAIAPGPAKDRSHRGRLHDSIVLRARRSKCKTRWGFRKVFAHRTAVIARFSRV